MSIITHTNNVKRLHVAFNDERNASSENYAICLASMNRHVVVHPRESPAVTL